MGANAFYSLDGPLDAIPAQGQMRAANLDGFARLVRNLGGNPRDILERNCIDPRVIRNPDDYISCQSLVDVLEECSGLFNDPLFGLRLAQTQEAEVFGCVTALCRAASSFGEAIDSLIAYIPVIHAPVTMLELAQGKETVELRWGVRTDLGTNSQANYQAALLDVKLLRAIGGRNFQPSYVNLAVDSRSKDIADIESKLGCPFHCKSSTNAIAFPSAIMHQAISSSNSLVFRLLGGYLDRVKTVSRTSVVERVEDYIRGALPLGTCSIEHCAKKLGPSVRTLQAGLSDVGLKFSDILEQHRLTLAKGLLEQCQLSLDEVAFLLGYSEQSSFGRAFKRWTGSTPQQFRAVHARSSTQLQ